MRILFFCILFLAAFCLAGCFATSEHTKKADKVTADFAQSVANFVATAHPDMPEIAEVQYYADELDKIALEDPGPKIPPAGWAGLEGILTMILGPGAAGSVMMLVMKMREANSLKGMVRDLSELSPEESKKYLSKSKLKV